MSPANSAPVAEHPPRWEICRVGLLLALALLTAAAWQLCFAPLNQWYLAYVVLVPWTVTVVCARSGRWAMLVAWIAGVAAWAVGLYWLTWITLVGYVALALFLGVFWLAAAWIVRRAFRRGWPLWLTLPVVWVGLEYVRAFLLSGFPWFFLAHSQYRCTRLIQVADLFGQHGVSFFVAMVNGLVAEILLRSGRALTRPCGPPSPEGRGVCCGTIQITRSGGIGLIVTAVVLAGLLGYGTWRLNQQTTTPGPVVGVVQCAFPISLAGRSVGEKDIFDAYMNQARPLVNQKLDLMVWPETMLPGDFDKAWLNFDLGRPTLDEEDRQYVQRKQAAQRELNALLREANCPLLAGGITLRPTPVPLAGEPDKVAFNTAMLLTAGADDEPQIRQTYDKMHLVPFGEYVPLRRAWPTGFRALRWFVPSVMDQLWPGERVARFETRAADGRTYRFATPICYEGVFDRVCRRLGYSAGQKKIDLLVNISNDGWFIWQRGDKTHGSTELDQHLAAYVFRAIEARVPVARAVNTGMSGFIDSNGRIGQLVADKDSGQSKMMLGQAHSRMLVDSRRSVYCLFGSWAADGVRAGISPATGEFLGRLVGDVLGDPFALASTLGALLIAVKLRRQKVRSADNKSGPRKRRGRRE